MKVAFLILVFFSHFSLFAQTSFDSVGCQNEYQDDIEEAIKDSCLVSLTLTCPGDSGTVCNIPRRLASVKRLFTLEIITKGRLAVPPCKYYFLNLYSAYIQGELDTKSIPVGFFDSPILNDITLVYKNEISEIPIAVTKRTGQQKKCIFAIHGNEQNQNNSRAFFRTLKSLITSEKYSVIILYNCFFSPKDKDELGKAGTPSSVKFIYTSANTGF